MGRISEALAWIIFAIVVAPSVFLGLLLLTLYPAAIAFGTYETVRARREGRPRWWTGLLAPLYAGTVATFDLSPSLLSTTASEVLTLGAVGFYVALSWPLLWGLSRLVQRSRQPS